MARYRQERITSSLKRSLYGPTLKPIETDYTMKEVNSLLSDILGKPGNSAGRVGAQKGLGTNTGPLPYSEVSPAMYSSAQIDAEAWKIHEAETQSSGGGATAIAAGIGLIRDLIGYYHADKAAEVAYERQNEFYDNHMSMPAKVQEYNAAGLNPMGLAGAGVGATSAPSIQPSQTPANSPLIDVLGQLLNYKLRSRELDIEKEKTKIMGDNVSSQIEYRTEQKIYQAKINSYVDEFQSNTLEKIKSENDLLREQIETEDTKQALNNAGVSVAQAQAALAAEEALQKAFQNSPEYRQAELALMRAQTNANNASAAESYKNIQVMGKQIDVMDENIKNIKQDTALKFAQTEVGKQTLKNLGIQEKELQFIIDHQRGDLIWKRVEQVVGVVKDLAGAAGDIVDVAVTLGTKGASKAAK